MLAPGSNPGSRASWTSSTCDPPDLSGLSRPDRSHYSWISALEFDGQPLPEGYSLETASLLLREAWAVIDVVERDGVRCNRIVQLLPLQSNHSPNPQIPAEFGVAVSLEADEWDDDPEGNGVLDDQPPW